METLESEPLALRLSWIRAFEQNGLSFMQARILEDRLHWQRCDSKSKPWPQWNQNGLYLGLTDSPNAHKMAARYAYLDFVMNAMQRLREKQTFESIMDQFKSGTIEKGPPSGQQDTWKSQLDRNLAFAKKVLEEKESSSKGIFQCPSCKSFDVDTEQKQTRSADEPMTIFCHCTQCNRRFVR